MHNELSSINVERYTIIIVSRSPFEEPFQSISYQVNLVVLFIPGMKQAYQGTYTSTADLKFTNGR